MNRISINVLFTCIFFGLFACFSLPSFSQIEGDEKPSSTTQNDNQIVIQKRVLTDIELSKVLRYNQNRTTTVNAQVYLDGNLKHTFENIQSKPCRCNSENMFQYNFVDRNMNMVSIFSKKDRSDYGHFSVVLITETQK